MNPRRRALERMSDDELLEYLGTIAAQLADVDEQQRTLWAERIAVYQEGRLRDPALTYGQLASAAKVSEVAIITKLRQIEQREADAEATTG